MALNYDLHEKAKQMIIDGKDFNTIMEETHLRLKDLKKIKRKEIMNHF